MLAMSKHREVPYHSLTTTAFPGNIGCVAGVHSEAMDQISVLLIV